MYTLRDQQKTPTSRGWAPLLVPSSCEILYFAGIGTLRATLRAGCWASQGRFPPPFWMRAVITARILLSSNMNALGALYALANSLYFSKYT